MIDAVHAPASTAALVAAAASLCLVPTAVWIATWSGFVTIPRVGPGRGIPYLGGPAVALAVLAGSQLAHGRSFHVALALVLAIALAVVGLVDDHRPLSPIVRFLLEAIAAGIFVAVTGPLALTGAHAIDFALSVFWVVTVVNGINFLDNSDALAAIVVGLAGVGLAVTAGAHTTVGVCAAAIAGACAAFSAFNLRPAAIYLGDAGSMFLGFLLPALAIELVHTTAQPIHATWIAITLLALPVLEIVITSTRRIAHGRRLTTSAPDNLSYALARRGIGMHGALLVHALAQMLLLVAAVLVFKRTLAAPLAVALVATELVLLAAATRGADVHGLEVHWTRRARNFAFVALVGTAIVVGVGTLAIVRAYRAASAGASTLSIATQRLRAGDTTGARTAFATAERQLALANDVLGPLAIVTRVVPGIGQNVNAAHIAIDAGRNLAHDGARFADSVDVHAMRLRNAQIPIAAVQAAQRPLEALARSVARAQSRVAAIDNGMLLAPVAHKLGEIRSLLDRAKIATTNAADVARVAPAVFGAERDRHYLVVVQNPAEARATGGIPASFGVLEAHNGALDLGDLQPVEQLDAAAQALPAVAVRASPEYLRRYRRFEPGLWWENMPMSPDFPTVASVMLGQYERQTHNQLDGVISIDPSALRAILRISGPVRVADWPTPITADNVGDVVLRDEYVRFAAAKERKAFLGRVTAAAWKGLRRSDLGDPLRLANTLGPAAQQRHLLVWLAHPREQRIMRDLRVDGGVPDPTGDALFATVQNAAGTKLDLYMSRQLSYNLTVEPVDTHRANIRGKVSFSISNEAPRDLPAFVATPAAAHYQIGELHSFVSIYSALDLADVSIDGAPGALERNREFGRWVYSTFVSAKRGHRTKLDLALKGTVPLESSTYELRLLPQPGARDEIANAIIRVPNGFTITGANGCTITTAHECRRAGPLMRAEVVVVRIRSN
jgi:UDP-N-acetylmuramyl pentapeptide phosphotransferase/UDP-N-acetylglucosamine-1-phosphate transferase